MLLMFMVIMMTATPLMQGVVEEKMQRIAEVLLGFGATVRADARQTARHDGGVADHHGGLPGGRVLGGAALWLRRIHLPPHLLAWFVVFQALAALMYGSLFIAIGAACTDMKETQNLMWPVMLLAMHAAVRDGQRLAGAEQRRGHGRIVFPLRDADADDHAAIGAARCTGLAADPRRRVGAG